MEENPNNTPLPSEPEPSLEAEHEPATGSLASPQPIPPDTDNLRKSYVKPLLMGGGIVIVIALVIAGALLYWPHNVKTTVASVATTSKTSSTGATNNQAVNNLTSTLTNGANGETSLTSTDDSGEASAASQSAGNVGDSINENNF